MRIAEVRMQSWTAHTLIVAILKIRKKIVNNWDKLTHLNTPYELETEPLDHISIYLSQEPNTVFI